MGCKIHVVSLTDEERSELVAFTRGGKVPPQAVTRAKILLKADQGQRGPAWTDAKIAEALDVSRPTVANVRRRFSSGGIEAAVHRRQRAAPGRKPKLDAKGTETLIAVAYADPPKGRKRWTLNLIGERLVELKVVDSISYETVRKYLKKRAAHLASPNPGASRRRTMRPT